MNIRKWKGGVKGLLTLRCRRARPRGVVSAELLRITCSGGAGFRAPHQGAALPPERWRSASLYYDKKRNITTLYE